MEVNQLKPVRFGTAAFVTGQIFIPFVFMAILGHIVHEQTV